MTIRVRILFNKTNQISAVDYESLIEKKRHRIPELESEMAQEGFYDDPKQAQELTREYNRTKSLLDDWEALGKARVELEENTELAKSDDSDMAEMAAESSKHRSLMSDAFRHSLKRVSIPANASR